MDTENKSIKELRESMKAMRMHDPMKELRESMNAMRMYDPMEELRESMKTMQMHDPMEELRESMMAMQMHDPMKELRESMMAMQMHDPMKELRESLKAYRSINSLGEIIKNISDNRWNLELESESGIERNLDGSISIDSAIYTQEQVQEIAQQVVSAALDGGTHVFEKQIDKLIYEIRSFKDPVLQKILMWLIYPLIVGLLLSVVSPISDFYIKEALNSGEKRQLIKDVSKAITITSNDKSLLKSFKIVTATSLNVRKSGHIKSEIIENLYLGDIVEVIEKGRKWSLITWQDSEANTLVRGWVFSRHLKVIK